MSECDNIAGRLPKYSSRAHSKNSLLNSPPRPCQASGRPPQPTGKSPGAMHIETRKHVQEGQDLLQTQVQTEGKSDAKDCSERKLQRTYFLKLVGLRQLAMFEITRSQQRF